MLRKSASSHRTKSLKRNTKHKSKDIKDDMEEANFADDKEQINSIQKNGSQRLLELLTKKLKE